jgi:hypothetical protein
VTDEVSRGAARLAALIAVPLALIAGVVSYWVMGGFDGDQPDEPAPTSRPPAATGPVAVSAPALSPPVAAICRALVAKLPPTIREAAQRPVTAGAEQNAAYGDPAITLACGVIAPSFPATDNVYLLDAVCWHAGPAPGGGATRWTTVDRTVPVAVTVPDAYEGQAQWVIGFSKAVAEAVPAAPTKPFGCR